MKSARLWSVTALCLLTGTACAPTAAVWDPTAGVVPGRDIQLLVTNDYGFPLEVYAIGGGTFYKMGRVLPGLPGRFILRPSMIGNGPIEFVARAGERNPAVRSGQLLLTPGNTVDFRIGTHWVNSSAYIRR